MSGAWVVATDRHGRDIVVIGTDQIAPAARFAHLDPSTHRWGGSWDARYVLHRDGTASQTHNPKRGRPAVVFSNVQKRPEEDR